MARNQIRKESSSRPETNLVTLPIDDIMEANEIFGKKTSGGNTPILLKPTPRTGWRMIVPTGFDTIVSENGKVIGIFKPGLYYRSSFFQFAYLVKTHHIPYHFAIKSCPTKDDIFISVDVDFLFHVTDSYSLVYKIGPESMENLLRATQAEAIRSHVRNVHSSRVYDLRGIDSDDMLTSLNDKMNEYGIKVDQVTISNVALPSDIAENLQNTTTFDAKQGEQVKKQELEMKILDDAQYAKRVEQDRKNEVETARENGKKNHRLVENEIEEEKAKIQRQLNVINNRARDQEAELQAQIDGEVGKIENERDKVVAEVDGETSVKVRKIRNEGEQKVNKVKAKTELKVAEIYARITQINAEAEKYASERIAAKRELEIEQNRIGLLESLAKNPNSFITGSGDLTGIQHLFASTQTADALGIKVKK